MAIRKTTTAGDVKAAAYAALRTAYAALPTETGGKPVQVAYGFPGESNMASEVVFLAGITLDDDWAQIGNGARDENYTITLVINVERQGRTQQQVTDRCFELLAVADRALTSSNTVQLLPPPARTLLAFGQLSERPADKAREAQIVAGLRVFARL